MSFLASFQPSLKSKFNLYIQLTRLNKPIGIYLLLWPTLLALCIGARGQAFPWHLCWIFILGSILMRSAGCVMNDYFDQDFDIHVKRTENRPLAQKKLSNKSALYLALGFCTASAALLFFLPMHVLPWALLALFLAASYPLAKRWLVLPQAYLGISFSAGMIMAYLSLHPWDWVLSLLLIGNIAYVLGYDTIYAMIDQPDDEKIGIHTSARFFGQYAYIFVILLSWLHVGLHLFLLYCLAPLVNTNELGVIDHIKIVSVIILIMGICLLLLRHHGELFKHKHTYQPALYWRIFLQSHWIALGLCLIWGIALF